MKGNTMKTTATLENLKSALEAVTALDARDIVGDFLAFKHSCTPGSYCAAVLDPSNGDINHVNEPSWCCSTDEYFGESGVLSRHTLISSTREHWSPGPDDKFEWTDGEDYVHPEGDYAGWITAYAYNDLDEDDQEKYTEWFSVGDVPVNGWLENADGEIEDVEKQIQGLVESIQAEIEEVD
jgi:hypothetical protein